MRESRWKPENLGLFYGVLGAMLFACKGIFIKLAYRHGVDTETFLGLRMLWAAPFFAWVAWRSDAQNLRRWWRRARGVKGAVPSAERGRWQGLDARRTGAPSQAPSSMAVPSESPHAAHASPSSGSSPAADVQPASVWRTGDVGRVIALGFSGYYLASYLDFLGLQYISVGLERVLLYLGPTFVLLLSVFWLKRAVGRRQWTALAVSYLGVILVYLHDLDVAGQSNIALGSLLVLGSCISYAFYLLGAGELVGRLGSMRLTAWATLVACVLCVAQAFVMGGFGLFRQPMAVQGIALMTAIFCTVFPLFLTTAAVARLGAGKAAQVGMIGPAWTIFLGAMILGEPAGGLQIAGTAIVILGVLMLNRVGANGR
ncbi:MAG: DMT family transporter [Lautropia sp.]|nr:DMT family transporter [Lautropia sp.]